MSIRYAIVALTVGAGLVGCASSTEGDTVEATQDEQERIGQTSQASTSTDTCDPNVTESEVAVGRRRALGLFTYLTGGTDALAKQKGGFTSLQWFYLQSSMSTLRSAFIDSGSMYGLAIKSSQAVPVTCGSFTTINVEHELQFSMFLSPLITGDWLEGVATAVNRAFGAKEAKTVLRFLFSNGTLNLKDSQSFRIDPEPSVLTSSLGSSYGASASAAAGDANSGIPETAYRVGSSCVAKTYRFSDGQTALNQVGQPCVVGTASAASGTVVYKRFTVGSSTAVCCRDVVQ